jgi:hypothetical protein
MYGINDVIIVAFIMWKFSVFPLEDQLPDINVRYIDGWVKCFDRHVDRIGEGFSFRIET